MNTPDILMVSCAWGSGSNRTKSAFQSLNGHGLLARDECTGLRRLNPSKNQASGKPAAVCIKGRFSTLTQRYQLSELERLAETHFWFGCYRNPEQPSSAVESPPRCHRRAVRSCGRWAYHHTHRPPLSGQSDRQSGQAAARPATDRPHPDRSASAPRSCRWRHQPPDAACAMSGAISYHASPPAIGPRRRPAGRCCRSIHAMDPAVSRLAASPAGSPPEANRGVIRR